MIKTVKKKDIPENGDIVDHVKYNKDRTIGCIFFDSGSKVYFAIDSGEFKNQQKRINSTPKSKNVNAMDKNTPADEAYLHETRCALARMRGVSVDQIIAESLDVPSQTNQDANSDDFEKQKLAVLESSAVRSQRLSEDLSRSHGGTLESAFKGQQSISI